MCRVQGNFPSLFLRFVLTLSSLLSFLLFDGSRFKTKRKSEKVKDCKGKAFHLMILQGRLHLCSAQCWKTEWLPSRDWSTKWISENFEKKQVFFLFLSFLLFEKFWAASLMSLKHRNVVELLGVTYRPPRCCVCVFVWIVVLFFSVWLRNSWKTDLFSSIWQTAQLICFGLVVSHLPDKLLMVKRKKER